MPDARAHAPATSCLPARRWRHPRVPHTPLDPLHLSPLSRVSPSVPIPLCSLSLPRPNGARRRRPALARPQPSRSLSDTPSSSAGPPSSSSSSHATRRAPERRPRRFPPRRPPRIFSVEFGHSGAPPSSLTLPARSP